MNILGPQLLVLFEEVLETSGGGASLEEVGYWGGGALKVIFGLQSFLFLCIPAGKEPPVFLLPLLQHPVQARGAKQPWQKPLRPQVK